jgi:hypothetical protein
LEPPCDNCYVKLDEHNIIVYNLYSLVRNQVRMTGFGDIIDLDYTAVLDVVKLHVAAGEVKETFNRILECFNIERSFVK